MQKLTDKSVKALSSVKGKLLALITKIENEIKQSMEELEEDEINANSDAADFQREVEEETIRLTKENKALNVLLIKLQSTLETTITKSEICEKTLITLIKSVEVAQFNLDSATKAHNEKRKRLLGEISLFTDVIKIYKQEVLGAAETVKNRVEDYNEDKKFDKTSETTERETEKFEKLDGKVKEHIEEQAKTSEEEEEEETTTKDKTSEAKVVEDNKGAENKKVTEDKKVVPEKKADETKTPAETTEGDF